MGLPITYLIILVLSLFHLLPFLSILSLQDPSSTIHALLLRPSWHDPTCPITLPFSIFPHWSPESSTWPPSPLFSSALPSSLPSPSPFTLIHSRSSFHIWCLWLFPFQCSSPTENTREEEEILVFLHPPNSEAVLGVPPDHPPHHSNSGYFCP